MSTAKGFTTRTILIGSAVVLTLVATLAWASVHPSSARATCLTQADVAVHFERSRSGISLTCNDEIRLRNLDAGTSR